MPTQAKDRFLCIECMVQTVVVNEIQDQSAALRSQREQRLCTNCMYKRQTGTKQAGTKQPEKHIRETVRVWRDRT